MGVSVAEFTALLGLKVDRSSFDRGQRALDSMRDAAIGITAYFGGAALGRALFGFNASLEEARNQIAGMFALAKHTNFNDELATADKLVDSLRQRAAKLPGSTQDYINMLGMLVQPLASAKLGMQDIEDITVNSVVAAKSFGLGWQQSARDIDQALRGQFHSTDAFTGKILESVGYVGEAGRARFNAMGEAARAAALKGALTQKQLTQMADAQGKTMNARWETLKSTIAETLGRVGLPLFKKLSDALEGLNGWLDDHKEELQEIANMIGGVLSAAFDWLKEHTTEVKAALIALATVIGGVLLQRAMAFIKVWGPLFAAIDIGMRIFEALRGKIGDVGAAIVAAFAAGGILLFISKVRELTAAMLGLKAAQTGGSLGAAGEAAGAAGKMGKVGAVAKQIPLIAVAAEADMASREHFGGGLGMGGTEKMFGEMEASAKRTLELLPEFVKNNEQYGKYSTANVYGQLANFNPATFNPDAFGRPSVQATGPTPSAGSVSINAPVTISITDASDPKAVGEEVNKQLSHHWTTIATNRGIPQ